MSRSVAVCTGAGTWFGGNSTPGNGRTPTTVTSTAVVTGCDWPLDPLPLCATAESAVSPSIATQTHDTH
ncbi:MAG: hypothetical protein QM736_00085 [Vicinamibacterales bacterium]